MRVYSLLRLLAEQGDAKAQFNVSTLYQNGQGVAQDYAKAHAWFERTAMQGYVPAQYNLGALYVRGLSVEHDEDKARALFERASQIGRAHV